MRRFAIALLAVLATWPAVRGEQAAPAAAPPGLLLDTVKGQIEIQLFQTDAPKSVAHILGLAKRNFYRGFRVHRVTAGLVQFGDPATRNMTLIDSWGTGNSQTPIGVAEISKKRLHVRGAVGLAHSGDARYADSQIYIMKAASPGLDGKHAVIGQVTKGLAIVDKLVKTDLIKNVTPK